MSDLDQEETEKKLDHGDSEDEYSETTEIPEKIPQLLSLSDKFSAKNKPLRSQSAQGRIEENQIESLSPPKEVSNSDNDDAGAPREGRKRRGTASLQTSPNSKADGLKLAVDEEFKKLLSDEQFTLKLCEADARNFLSDHASDSDEMSNPKETYYDCVDTSSDSSTDYTEYPNLVNGHSDVPEKEYVVREDFVPTVKENPKVEGKVQVRTTLALCCMLSSVFR